MPSGPTPDDRCMVGHFMPGGMEESETAHLLAVGGDAMERAKPFGREDPESGAMPAGRAAPRSRAGP